MPKIILSAGAFRSGSTWLYNAIRLVLMASGAKVSAGWIEDVKLDAPSDDDYLIIKVHEPHEQLRQRAWRILTSHRDLRDVARSASDFLRVKDGEALVGYAELAMTQHLFWAQHAHYDLRYESMKDDPEQVLHEIAAQLGVDLPPEEIAKIRNALAEMPEPRDADKYDATSLLHPEHCFGGEVGGWVDRLAPEASGRITAKFLSWMVRYGYVGPDGLSQSSRSGDVPLGEQLQSYIDRGEWGQAVTLLAVRIKENPDDAALANTMKALLISSPATMGELSWLSPGYASLETRLNAAENLLLSFLNHFNGAIRPLPWLEALKQKSVAQLGQDLWVLEQTHYKRNGYFVEFGATDGISLSNTYLLETEFGWDGILAEPNPVFFQQLEKNRHCITTSACIAGETGREVEFILADVYGGMEAYAGLDMHADTRKSYSEKGERIKVTTISLHDFLLQNNAPRRIDYLSIDTEGSELEILSAFPFEQWDIGLLTIEHNFTPQRAQIRSIMQNNGYNVIERGDRAPTRCAAIRSGQPAGN